MARKASGWLRARRLTAIDADVVSAAGAAGAAGAGLTGSGQPRALRDLLIRAGGRRAVTSAVVSVVGGLAAIAAVATVVDLASSNARASGHAVANAGRPGAAHGRRLALARVAPLRVVSVTPSGRTGGLVGGTVSGTVTIRVTFSAPLAAGSPSPVLRPATPGQWRAWGRTMTFAPDQPLAPSARFTLRVPAGPAGVRSSAGGLLTRPVTVRFRTARYSRLRLAQLLAQLGYLPMTWQPFGHLAGDFAGGGLVAQQRMAYSPPPGAFSWARGYPAGLHRLWRSRSASPLVQGAVMAFQSQHHMAINGTVSRRLWRRLFAAADDGQRNSVGYTYAVASKGSPETLTVWHDGRIVLRSLANTGIPVAPTESGTYPVYLRFRFQIMQGTNPDGSHYADPVSYVAYFHGGDAVHYFPRGAYGYPQSLGCVELPYDQARTAWPYLTYGSLVTVTG